jgi:hypothetical protein
MNANVAVMDGGEAARPSKKWVLWAGRVASALPILALLMSAAMKLTHAPQLVGQLTGHLGYSAGAVAGIGLVELLCAVVYAIPAASVLGALLVSAYLGGAVASHVRVGDPYLVPVVLGILTWIGLYLRDPRLRKLLPLRAG